MDLDQYLEKMITNTIVIWIRYIPVVSLILLSVYTSNSLFLLQPIIEANTSH